MLNKLNYLKKNKRNKTIEIEEFIEKYKILSLKNNIFKNEDDLIYFFTRGGCYIFARLLKKQFPYVKISINKEKTHSGVIYNNYFFDIFGKHSIYKDNFKIANKKDLKYMKDTFGFIKYPSDDFEKIFIEDCFNGINFNNGIINGHNLEIIDVK